jgi:hypothetical protein
VVTTRSAFGAGVLTGELLLVAMVGLGHLVVAKVLGRKVRAL